MLSNHLFVAPENSTRTKMRPFSTYRGWFASPLLQLSFIESISLDSSHLSVSSRRLMEVNRRYKHRCISSEVGTPSWIRPTVSLSTVYSSRIKAGGWLWLEINNVINPHSPEYVACDDRRHGMVPGIYPTTWERLVFVLPAEPVTQKSASAYETSRCIELYLLIPTPYALFQLSLRKLNSKLCYGSVWRAGAAWGPVSTLNMGT